MNNVKIKYCVWQARNAQVIYAEKPQIKKTVRKPWYQIYCKWYVVSFTERVNWNYAFSPFNKFLRIWVFATNPNFIIPKSQQPDDAYLSYFKLTLFDLPEFIVWNIYGLRHLVIKKLRFKNLSLWQRLRFFNWMIAKEIVIFKKLDEAKITCGFIPWNWVFGTNIKCLSPILCILMVLTFYLF